MSLRQQKKVKSRASILAAANDLLNELGIEQTTTRAIAERAGVSYQTLYNYFPSKGEVLKALIDDDLSHWAAEVDARIKRYDRDLLGMLNEIHRLALDHLMDDLPLWREISVLLIRQEVASELLTSKTVAHEQYHALLSLAVGMGHLSKDLDLHLTAHTLFCLADHAMLRVVVTDVAAESVLQTLAEQIRLVLTPHLREDSST